MDDTTIEGAAWRAGVGAETIRLYERKGLITQPPKPANGGFRAHPQATVARIRFIRQAQGLGFSLSEVCTLLELRAAPGADAAEVRARAQAKLADVDTKIRQLTRIRGALRTLIAACPGQGTLGRCSIVEALEAQGANAGQRSRPQQAIPRQKK